MEMYAKYKHSFLSDIWPV